MVERSANSNSTALSRKAVEPHRRVIKTTQVVRVRTKDGDVKEETSAWQLALLALVVAALAVMVPLAQRTRREFYQSLLREKFNVTIVDDFLQDPDFIQKVQNDTLWRACHKITKGYIRFWYYPTNPPVNVFEELAVMIYKDTEYWQRAVSYEYWCNIIEDDGDPTNHMQHPWHTDRDEDVLEKEREFVVPLMGSVFYGYNESYEGGDFRMIDSVPYKVGTRARRRDDECDERTGMCVTNPRMFESTRPDEALRVETKFNRLLYANVTHFHKVDRVRSGRRYALAVNADHWMPYKVERAPTNDQMIELARTNIAERERTL